MDFEFKLNNDILGELVINQPDGWKDAKLKLERDINFKSINEYFDGSFIFYGDNGITNGGIDYIKEVEQTQGPDAQITITIRVSLDGYNYESCFDGILNLFGIIAMPDNKIQVPIIPNDFWTRFINRLDTPVNIQSGLSLDDEDVNNFDSINLKLTSQKIQKKRIAYEILPSDEWVRNGVNNTFELDDYIQISFSDNVVLDEITEFFNIPTSINPDLPVNILLAEFGGDYNFDIQIGIFTVTVDVGDVEFIDSNSYVQFYIQKNIEAPIALTHSIESYPGIFIPASGETDTLRLNLYKYNNTLSLTAGDEVRVYGQIINVGFGGAQQQIILATNEYEADNSFCDIFNPDDCIDYNSIIGIDRTYLKITAQTIFPESNAFSFFVHDVGGQIVDRYTSLSDRFYSEHLGSDRTLYRQYDADGCGWKYAISKGLQIRQYSLIEKPFFMSFNQWWKGINPVLCLGLGYEEVDGVQVIRVEQMEHFYDASSVSVNISNVRQISRSYDQDKIFKTVKVGYSKWQSEDISGIDDAQTKHTYATRLQKAGVDLTLESDFIAASLAIETTRRTTRLKSADYKFDNETFLIAVNPIPIDVSPETSPDVTDFEPELDENFSSINNLLNAETRYNSRITPTRNLMRWIRYVSGCLQSYIDSKFKFVSGEGNYDMTSDMLNVSDGCDEVKNEISEKQDLPVSNDPLHLSLSYEIVVPMEWEDYLLIRNNRKKAIGISQTTTDHVKFFIDTLEYELVKGRATIKAWPVEFFDIQIIETTSNQNVCYAVPADCTDAYLTEDGFEYETEDGNCLILN